MFIHYHGDDKMVALRRISRSRYPADPTRHAAATHSATRLLSTEAVLWLTQKNHHQSGLFPQESCTTGSEGEYTVRMLDDTQQQSIVTRLNRVEGQIRGIRRMVQEPRLFVEILHQVSAAEAALNRISLAVFKFHVERCVPDGVVLGEPEKTKRLTELVDIFDRFAK
jgi:DNA-binding FrmR family transcriptional regulator